jgi:hypothetical protein
VNYFNILSENYCKGTKENHRNTQYLFPAPIIDPNNVSLVITGANLRDRPFRVQKQCLEK